jgi:DNA-binding transcriptional ArsR family regulator
METRRDVFHAIADPTRRSILLLLALKAMTPTSLAEKFDTSRQAISRHIKVLTECQLVKQTLSGREIYYQVNPANIKEVTDWLAAFTKIWEKKFERLDEALETLKQQNNGK